MGDLTYSVVTGLEDADPTSLSIGYSVGAISGSVATSDEGDASNMTVSYAMGDITLAYEMGSMDNENSNEEVENHKQIAVSYAVAPGIKTTFTSSEVDSTADNNNDKEQMEIQVTLSF